MTVDELLRELDQRQVDVWVDGKLLRFRARDNAVDKELLAALRRHKNEIIWRLGRQNGQPNGDSRLESSSIGQQALYFLHSLAPESPAYNAASAARIQSVVDVAAMQQAFQGLVSRHASLRTTFEMQSGQVKRRVHSHGELDFQQIDAGTWNKSGLDEAVRREYQRSFDLEKGALLRVRLFTASEEDHVFLMTLHHIVFDAWSLWILQDEFRQLYQQYAGGETVLLPVLEATYSDFVRQQQSMLAGGRGEQLWQYWQQQLAGDLTPPDLPLDHPRPDRPSLRGASHHFRVPSGLSARLRELGRLHGATPFVVMLAIFKTLLYRYTGQDDLIVGTTTSGRHKTDFARVLGYFVNTLAVRTEVSGGLTFPEYLEHVKARTLKAIEHQEFPFPLIVNRLNPRRDSGRLPICTVTFGLHKPQQSREIARLFGEQSSPIDWGGLEVHPFELDQQEGQFDLTLEMFDTEDSYFGTLKYDLDLFRAETAERMSQHFVQLAESIVEDPQRPLADFELLQGEEQNRVRQFSESGPPPWVTDSRVHRLFELQAERSPDRVAVVFETEPWSYANLNRRANQAARWLRDQGLQPGWRVACRLQRGIDVPVLLLAILKAGGTYVPLDSTSPEHRAREIIRDCAAEMVLLHEAASSSEGIGRSSASQRSPKVVVFDPCSNALGDFAQTNLELDTPSDAAAYVIYTSGSTGQPKGVCVSHRAFAEHICCIREAFRLVADDRVLQFASHAFDPSLEQMFAPWSLGATVVLRGSVLWSPEEFWDIVRNQGLTVANLPPAYFKQCSLAMDSYAAGDCPLRLLIIGGDLFPVETLAVWEDKPVRILNAYGPTETVVTATVFDATRHDASSARVPIGRPKRGLRAYVLDEERRPVPIGVPGELYLAGSMLADGYLNDESLTAAKFLADPFVTDRKERMYRTGDRARWMPSGDLEYLGRTDSQIKISGYRVETGEVETVLNSCDEVRESVVQARSDRHGDAYLVAWVVAEEGRGLDLDQLRAFLRSRLPGYMVPRQFVAVGSLPMTVSGKIDAKRLPAPPAVRSTRSDYVAPSTDIERTLARIWAEVLSVDSVGTEDDFFDLGGGSLTSLRIVARASEAGLEVNGEPLKPELLFEYPTVGQLAAVLES